ncbi:MAG: long-chain fatty acid--CoA ligase [Desulfobacterales bacterium]|nr:long-chain fatty acid--CoA ligase [Desulfobacterales bacterium]
MYDDGVPPNVNFDDKNLCDYFKRTVNKFPGRDSLIYQGKRIKYSELDQMVNRFAACLKDFGIKKGDSVAILLPNLVSCVVSYFAILKTGAVVVMNNPLYSDVELEHQFKDSGAKVLITLDLLAKRMVDLREKTSIKQIVYASIGDYLPFPKNLLFPLVGKKKKLTVDVKPAVDLYAWKDLINKYEPLEETVKLSMDDTAMYQYTGGTTGVSKGAVLTHGNLSRQLQQIHAWMTDVNDIDKEIMLGALPFFHVMGLTCSMNNAIFMGWTTVLVPKPQPDQLIEALSKFKPTIAPLVPTMFIGILNHPKIDELDLSSIKTCVSGSAPLAVDVIKSFEEKTGSIIVEAFGMTETSPSTHCNPLGEGKRKVGSVGTPLPNTECKVVSLNDGETEVPVGEAGELMVRGPQVMAGYHNMPSETSATMTDDKWLHTGDIVKMDEDGFFFIVDRMKDMIISGGFNVYPRDIDEVLFEHPKVQEACSIGVPHPTRGEQIKAFVVLIDGASADEKEFIEYCATKLANYKLPTEIEFRGELPKTNVGKILRKDLREEELQRRSLN